MSVGETSGPIHPVPTERSGYRYQFYTKHHGLDRSASQWLPSLTHDQEFEVFNTADRLDFSDEVGRLYGLRPRSPDGSVQELGTRAEQIAEFPNARANEAWHGYPIWPPGDQERRRGELCRPSETVFVEMEESGVLTHGERKSLEKGRHP